jgi:hypothetical protein
MERSSTRGVFVYVVLKGRGGDEGLRWDVAVIMGKV